MGTMAGRLTIVAVTLMLTGGAACARPDEAGAPPPADPGPLDADTVAIRVDYTGGFVPVTLIPSRLPLVSVYGDGRVITEGPVAAIHPGPALPNVLQRKVLPEDVIGLVRSALDAGVGSAFHYGQPSVTDAPSTRFSVTTAEGVKRVEVYALEMTEEAPNRVLTDAQRAARMKLTALLDTLRNPPMPAGTEEPYPVTALAAIAIPYQEPIPADRPALAWGGPALPGTEIGPGARAGCVSVSGDAAKAVLASAASANADTPWTSGGRTWSLRLRPLLPDESGCADLAAQR
jgi:hypothetical protein